MESNAQTLIMVHTFQEDGKIADRIDKIHLLNSKICLEQQRIETL